MFYSRPVFRPPSERDSLLLQVCVGCARASCSYCMCSVLESSYVRDKDAILADVAQAGAKYGSQVRKVFYLGASAIGAPTATLCAVTERCRALFPDARWISSYAHPVDLLKKSEAELREIVDAGLNRLYIGVESGSRDVLRFMRKGGTPEQIEQACLRAADAGFTLSCQIIVGLGGTRLSDEHARETARLLGRISPHFAGFLNLMVVPRTQLARDVQRGRFEVLDSEQYLDELERMVAATEPCRQPIVVRSNHPSNYLSLGGTLPDDRVQLLSAIRAARSGAAQPNEDMMRNL